MSARNFRPSRHGFPFTNHFELRDILDAMPNVTPRFLKRALRDISPQNDYGLCGGMCHAAYDFFLADRRIPGNSSPPEPPSRLYRYIRRRQINSFGRFPVARPIMQVFEWMQSDDATLERRTQEEQRTLLARLSLGKAAHLYLIRVGRGQDPWENHQVMAYGRPETLPEDDAVLFPIYDPNHCENDTIRLKVTLKGNRVACQQLVNASVSEDEPVRGFFISPYRRKRPPSSL